MPKEGTEYLLKTPRKNMGREIANKAPETLHEVIGLKGNLSGRSCGGSFGVGTVSLVCFMELLISRTVHV